MFAALPALAWVNFATLAVSGYKCEECCRLHCDFLTCKKLNLLLGDLQHPRIPLAGPALDVSGQPRRCSEEDRLRRIPEAEGGRILFVSGGFWGGEKLRPCRLNAGPNALCASEARRKTRRELQNASSFQAVCRDLCAGRHDCHTAQVPATQMPRGVRDVL